MDNPSRLALILDKLKNLTKFQKIMIISTLILVVVIVALVILKGKPADVPRRGRRPRRRGLRRYRRLLPDPAGIRGRWRNNILQPRQRSIP